MPIVSNANIFKTTGPNSTVITPITNVTSTADETYQTICKVLNGVAGSGGLFMGAGYCVAMCDLLYNLLLHNGIKCHIVEVTLTISSNQSKSNRSTFAIGFDKVTPREVNTVDTHVVLITQTEIPYIIDPSISHKLPPGFGAVVASCAERDGKLLLDYVDSASDVRLTYNQKEIQNFPLAHQVSIVDRISKDRNIEKRLKIVTLLLLTSLSIGAVNLVRGGWDYYQTYVDQNNFWGPSHIKQIIERLDHLEQQGKDEK